MKKFLIVSSIVLTAGVLVFNACKKPTESSKAAATGKENSPSAVVVFSVGEAKILHADLTEEKATLGASLKTGDKVTTKENPKLISNLQTDQRFEFQKIQQSTLKVFPSIPKVIPIQDWRLFPEKFLRKSTRLLKKISFPWSLRPRSLVCVELPLS